jgi:hypothetical protein
MWAIYEKQYEQKICFATVKSMKKGVVSGVGSGSISQSYGPDPRIRTKISRIPNTANYYIDAQTLNVVFTGV